MLSGSIQKLLDSKKVTMSRGKDFSSCGNNQDLFLSGLSFLDCDHLGSQIVCEGEIPTDVKLPETMYHNPDSACMVSTVLYTEEPPSGSGRRGQRP